MKRILLDADVILDFFFDRKPFADHSSSILTLCELGKISGYITPVTCSNVYYLLRRTAAHEKVIEKLSQLLSITDVLSMDRNTVINALNSGFKDFEDALQYWAAFHDSKIEAIITRNIKDYKSGKIPVMTPEEFLTAIRLF